MSEHRFPDQKKPLLALFVRALVLCVVAGSMFFSLKGIGESLSPWSQATVTMLTNLFYNEHGRDMVTVLRFREQDLDSAGETDRTTGRKIRIPFPIPYSVHIEILDALAAREPEAVLVDFAFVDKRSGDDIDILRDKFCDMKRMNIRVFVVAFNYFAPNHGLREDMLIPRAEESDAAPCFDVVPANFTAEKSGEVRTYQLVQGQTTDSPGVASAALRLFPAYSPSQLDAFRDKMDIVWGALPPRERRSDTPCSPVKPVETIGRLIKDGPGAMTRDCPYSNTLSVYSLLNETGSGGDDDDVTALTRGKLVLYGSGLVGTDDWIQSPVHGNIPGIYLHAMALDNLLVFNRENHGRSVANKYKRIGEHSFEGFGSVEFWVDLALIITGVAWYLMTNLFRQATFRATMKNQLSPRGLIKTSIFYLP